MNHPVTRFAAVADEPELGRLSRVERERHDRLRSAAARRAYASAHLLARDCLAALAGEPLEIAQRCADCGAEDHGAPYVVGRPDLFVSLSHSVHQGRAWVAAMAAVARCGIDVQVVSHVPDRALADRERAAVLDDLGRSRLWARKEALIKAGVAALADLGVLDVLDPDPRLRDWTGPEAAVVGAIAVVSSGGASPRLL